MGWFSNRKLRNTQRNAKAPGYTTQPNAKGIVGVGGQFVPAPYSGSNVIGLQVFDANALPGAWPIGIPNVESTGLLDVSGQKQPLPQTLYSQLVGSHQLRYNQFRGHSFVRARLPDPGAPAWTFDALGLVEFSPIGAGIINQSEILALEGAPLFATLGVVTQGLGGIVQGEIVLQPLVVDPTTQTDLQLG